LRWIESRKALKVGGQETASHRKRRGTSRHPGHMDTPNPLIRTSVLAAYLCDSVVSNWLCVKGLSCSGCKPPHHIWRICHCLDGTHYLHWSSQKASPADPLSEEVPGQSDGHWVCSTWHKSTTQDWVESTCGNVTVSGGAQCGPSNLRHDLDSIFPWFPPVL
jgi:hypothetical protein